MRRKTLWGWDEQLATGEQWVMKQLHLNPGQRTSLQKHQLRGEWWFPVEGRGYFLIGQETVASTEVYKWLYVSAGQLHRITGAEPIGLTFLELQLGHGCIPDELDILRLEDDFGRAGSPRL